MKISITKLLFFVLLINTFCFAQWGAGLYVNIKNESPQKGIGFVIKNNLPFQWPSIGFSLRFDADYFKEEVPGPDIIERDIALSLAGTLFFKDVQPYFAVGGGYAFHSANDENNNSVFIREIAGVQLAMIEPVYPFFELRFFQYLADLKQGRETAKKIQVAGALGIRFEF